MPYLALALFLLIVGLLWAGLLIFLMAKFLLSPRRMTEARAFVRLRRTSPADLGLAFEPITFTVNDARSGGRLDLATWWIPTPVQSSQTAIVVHGYGDAKVGGIAWAPTWQALGWNVLAVDLRAHGESGGTQSTAGYYEQDDLAQIIDQLREKFPDDTQSIALFGVSLGAACVAATAARRNDLAAVIMEAPYADYRDAVLIHVKRAGFPMVSAIELICRTAEWLARCDFQPVRPAATIPVIAAPVLVLAGEADPLIDIPALQKAVAARPAERISEIVVLPDVPHVMALAADPEGYAQRLSAFLSRAGRPAAASRR
jgi:pimeloyl-ACP methyl ester carboxylesterase